MGLSTLKRTPRLLWRDLILRAGDATLLLDEYMAAYLFSDTGYQYVWSKIDVHETLMRDTVRVEAFRRAILEKVKRGDRVLDVGTGAGILAMLAAKAGAGEVTGVDSASIIEVARKTANRNKIANVNFIRSDILDLDIPKADCIICELLGMQITDEGMIHKMENALRLLKDGGTTIPERIDICLVPVESRDAGLGFWRRLYGIDYSAVDKAPHEPRNYDMGRAKLLSKPKRIFTIDLKDRRHAPLRYEGVFTVASPGEFHGCVMYFEAKLSKNVQLSTHPHKPLTHWKHLFLPNDTRAPVKKGGKIEVEVKAVLRNTRWRWKYKLG